MLALLTGIGAVFGAKGKVAAAIGGLLSLVVLIGALWGLKALYDSSVIEDARRAGNAEAIELKAKADEHAAKARGRDEARAETEAEQLKETVDEAVEQGRDPRAAYYECVRLQQSARAANRPTPACG